MEFRWIKFYLSNRRMEFLNVNLAIFPNLCFKYPQNISKHPKSIKIYKKHKSEWFPIRMYLYPEAPPRCGSAKAVRARKVGIKSSQKCHGLRWQHVWKFEVSVYQRTSLETSWPWKSADSVTVNINDIKISKFVESVVSTNTLV